MLETKTVTNGRPLLGKDEVKIRKYKMKQSSTSRAVAYLPLVRHR